jgi:hypothetical protein
MKTLSIQAPPDKVLHRANRRLLEKRRRMGEDAYAFWINKRCSEFKELHGDIESHRDFAKFIKWVARKT